MGRNLRLENLTKKFGTLVAVDRVNLEIEEGEFICFLGPSGCGKTTVLRMITGFETVTEGNVIFDGKVINDLIPQKREFGIVFQSYALFPNMTVEENIAFGLRVRKMLKKAIGERVDQMLDLIGLRDWRHLYPAQLSGGQQQRLALARALVYEPDILLLDEPLSNLDAQLRQQMRLELKNLQRQLGTTFVFVTHDQDEAMTLAHRVALMRNGKIEQLGTPEEVYDNPNSLFVHSFLGTSIRFEGKWREDSQGACLELMDRYRLRPEPDAKAKKVAAGGRVLAALRPEDLQMVAARRPAQENEIEAEVRDVINLGDRYELALTGCDAEFVLEVSKRHRVQTGERVLLAVDAARIKVWPA
jgi:ABC-type Fe3+/spermidine/putrescine transport system ATPase subunit